MAGFLRCLAGTRLVTPTECCFHPDRLCTDIWASSSNDTETFSASPWWPFSVVDPAACPSECQQAHSLAVQSFFFLCFCYWFECSIALH
uniref:Putative secreted protein n=1 Tax=Anopheles marajoara TaxID=58244 RepID=A0A2M4CA76_9DIPT